MENILSISLKLDFASNTLGSKKEPVIGTLHLDETSLTTNASHTKLSMNIPET